MKKELLPKGIFFYSTERGWPVMAIHHLADPGKDEAWARRARAEYRSQALWSQEQDMQFGVGGGERLLRETLVRHWDRIVIREEHFVPKAGWSWGAGFDHGQAKPSAWPVMAKDHAGVVYAVAEHYRGGTLWTPNRHAEAMHGMHILTDHGFVKAVDLVADNTLADPSIFDATQAQAKGDYASIAQLYREAETPQGSPVPVTMKPGIRGDDLGFVNRLIQMWSCPDPLFKIVLGPRHNYAKRNEGTYCDGCPNLIWELLGIRRALLSTVQLENKAPTEKIVQKNNHIFDAVKYYFSGHPKSAEYTAEERWTQKVEGFRQRHSDLDDFTRINAEILMRKQFDHDERQQESYRWAQPL